MRPTRIAVALLVAALVACGSREVLDTLPATEPAGVDFSGDWTLRGDADAISRRITDAIRRTDDADDRIALPPARTGRPPAPRSSDGRIKGGFVYVFFENGERLKITQTPDGLFVSFDRAVVEEYRYGEQREIRVGQATAQRVSGWDGRDYVIETLDRNGMKLTERYQLGNDGDSLTRRITFRSKQGEAETVTQLFRRR